MPSRPGAALVLLVLAAFLGAAPAARAGEAEALDRAIARYENLDDEGATAALRRVLAAHPTRGVEAKAHLYLGLIAFNANSPDLAASEFKQALLANPAIELPRLSSPKALLLLSEVRGELEREAARDALAPPPAAAPEASPGASAAPAAATSAEAPAPAPRHPRAAAIALGVAGLLATAAAVYGGVQVLDWQSLVSRANASPRTVAGSQLVSSHGAAQFWADAWIPFAVAGGGCFLGTAFTW